MTVPTIEPIVGNDVARWLKQAECADEKKATDRPVRDTVERTLADIADSGDAAVRKLSAKSDNRSPDSILM